MIIQFIKEIFHERKVVWQLAKNDCKARFASAGLGVIWVFLQPLLNILILWFVFQVGFRSMPVEDTPFIVWYIPAFLSWNYFTEGVSQAANSLLEYSYLVKKVNFKVSIIPVIKVLSASIVHAAFVLFIVLINLLYGRPVNVYFFQMLYYWLCAFCLLLGLAWLLAAVSAFIRDVGNLVAVVLQIGFWATPLFWDPSTLDPFVQKVLKLNPMYYVCMGYRESIVSQIGFWQHKNLSLYFWAWVIVMFVVGIRLFRKLQPHFDDVL